MYRLMLEQFTLGQLIFYLISVIFIVDHLWSSIVYTIGRE